MMLDPSSCWSLHSFYCLLYGHTDTEQHNCKWTRNRSRSKSWPKKQRENPSVTTRARNAQTQVIKTPTTTTNTTSSSNGLLIGFKPSRSSSTTSNENTPVEPKPEQPCRQTDSDSSPNGQSIIDNTGRGLFSSTSNSRPRVQRAWVPWGPSMLKPNAQQQRDHGHREHHAKTHSVQAFHDNSDRNTCPPASMAASSINPRMSYGETGSVQRSSSHEAEVIMIEDEVVDEWLC